MDPLSIIASIITVLTVTTQGLHKLIDLREAPAWLQALSNELEVLRALITTLQISIQDFSADSQAIIFKLLEPVRSAVLTLEQLIQYQLIHPDKVDKHGQPKMSKSGWLMASSKAEEMRQQIAHARGNLQVGLSACNLKTSTSGFRVVSELHSISLVAGEDMRSLNDTTRSMGGDVRALLDEVRDLRAALRAEHQILHALHFQQGHTSTLQHGIQRLTDQIEELHMTQAIPSLASKQPIIQLHSAAVASDDQSQSRHVGQLARPDERTALDTSSGRAVAQNGSSSVMDEESAPASQGFTTARNATSGIESNIRVVTSICTGRCPKLCPCQCHSQQTLKTPDLLRPIIGSLMFRATHLVRPRPCDYRHCQKQAKRSNFTYYLPSWMASRAIMISSMTNDLSGIGASWSIRVPIVVPKSDERWHKVIYGDLAATQRCLAQGGNYPQAVNEDGETLLLAVFHLVQRISVLNQIDDHDFPKDKYDYLIRMGCDPLAEDCYRESAAAWMLWLKRGISNVPDVDDLADHMEFTILHVAVVMPSSECCLTDHMLRAHFRDIDARDRLGMTPLHWACRRGDVRCTRILLAYGAAVNLLDRLGDTAFQQCISSGNMECLNMVLEAGAAVNAVNHLGRAALHDALSAEVATILINHGADVNLSDKFQETPLLQHAVRDDVATVKLLLARGADVTIPNSLGETIWHRSIDYNQFEILAALIEHAPLSKIPSSRGFGGNNVLHGAARFGGVEVMRLLSQANLRGLGPLRTNYKGHTPDDAFYITRKQYKGRAPSGDEKAAWRALMDSARRQNGFLIESEDESEAGDEEEQLADDNEIESGSTEAEDSEESGGDEESGTEEERDSYADALEEIEP